jgi:molybdenum cofactor cytidylyltransferase
LIFAELPLAEAQGALLAHALTVEGKRYPKGTPVDARVAQAARAGGLSQLWVARLEEGDRPEMEAAEELGAGLAGPGIEARPPVHGRVNLHATQGGLLSFEPDRITAANLATDCIGISTVPPLSPVNPGDMVATVKIIPYAVPAPALAAATAALQPLRILGWRSGLSACLVQTRQADTPDKLLAKTREVTAARLTRLGVAMSEAEPAAHAVEPLAGALGQVSADLLLLAGASATSDHADIIPAAIRAAGGEVLRVGMPVDPGNLLVLGRLGSAVVIGLPGCARSPKRNGLDLLLEQWAAGIEPTAARIAAMGVGGLLEESGRPTPWGWSG